MSIPRFKTEKKHLTLNNQKKYTLQKNNEINEIEIGKKKKKSLMFLNCNFNIGGDRNKYNQASSTILEKESVQDDDVENMDNIDNENNKKNIKIYRKSSKPIQRKKTKIEEPNFPGYYNLVLVNEFNVKNKRPFSSKFILTNYNFKQAVKYDLRGIWHIFFIYLLFKQSIAHTFFFKTDLELLSLRICLFLFSFTCEFAFNALFYFNDNISDRYNYEGNNLILFSFVNNIIISIISAISSFVIRLILKYLTNSKKSIEKTIREQENKMRAKQSIVISDKEKKVLTEKISKILQILGYKIWIFIILEFCLMLFFVYYISAFCAVYKSTQTSWILDSFVSFLMVNLIDVTVAFVLAILYSVSIKYRIESLYNICLFFYDLGH